jgi:hypothetical protein
VTLSDKSLAGTIPAEVVRDGAEIVATRLRREPVGLDSDRGDEWSRLIVSESQVQRLLKARAEAGEAAPGEHSRVHLLGQQGL